MREQRLRRRCPVFRGTGVPAVALAWRLTPCVVPVVWVLIWLCMQRPHSVWELPVRH